jgi:hypothetical protein
MDASAGHKKDEIKLDSNYKSYCIIYLDPVKAGYNQRQPTSTTMINIDHINARLADLQKEIDVIKAEKQNIENPTIKGLGIKFSELDLSKASAVIHLHNALIERIEELTAKVQALEAKAK